MYIYGRRILDPLTNNLICLTNPLTTVTNSSAAQVLFTDTQKKKIPPYPLSLTASLPVAPPELPREREVPGPRRAEGPRHDLLAVQRH